MRHRLALLIVVTIMAGCLGQPADQAFTGTQTEYSIEQIVGIDGEMAVLGQRNGTIFLEYRGERYGEDVSIANPGVFDVNGDLAYVFSEPGTANDSLWYDGTVHGGRFNDVWAPALVDGELVYHAQPGSGPETVIVRDEEIIEDRYSVSTSPAAVDERLAYEAFEAGDEYIIHENTVHGPYDRVGPPKDIGGQLGYLYRNGSGRGFMLGGEPLTTDPDLLDVRSIGRIPAIVTAERTDVTITVGDQRYGDEIGAIYPGSIHDAAGVPAYVAAIDSRNSVVIGDQVVPGNYTVPQQGSGDLLAIIDGSPVFAGREDDSWHVYRRQ